MVLDLAATLVNRLLPSKYYIPAVAGVGSIFVVRSLVEGKKTSRERDLHGRVVLVTGAFTPLGLTLLQNLAERGAHIVAASPEPISSPRIDLLIEVLRSTTKNEHIYADYCDLESPHSVRDFCTRFLTGNDTRLDAIVFAHEYHNIGHVLTRPSEADDARRHALAMSTFLMITLLLPVFLVAPAERDIRIINVCNPFYAAAVPDFTPTEAQPPRGSSLFYKEGLRSLRTALLTRHLQRVLDALPNRTQAPETEGTQETVPVVSASAQKSNIVAVSVSPGISRLDTITPLLGSNISTLRFILYIFLYPIIFLFSKSSNAAVQTVLHALFLPTPFKAGAAQEGRRRSANPDSQFFREEVLKPGALYTDCAVVALRMPRATTSEAQRATTAPEKKRTGNKEKQKVDEAMTMPDDGEMGGLELGTMVWESFEADLKEWDVTPAEDGGGSSMKPASTSSSPTS